MHRSNRLGLWISVLVVALVVGAGWAANRQWHLLRWFQGEPPVEQAAVQPTVESQETTAPTKIVAPEPSKEQPEAQRTEGGGTPEPAPTETAAALPETAAEAATPTPAPAAGPVATAEPSAGPSSAGSAATPTAQAPAADETATADAAPNPPQTQETAAPSATDAAAAQPASEGEGPTPAPEDVAASSGAQPPREAGVADAGPADTHAPSPGSQVATATDSAQIQTGTATDASAPQELARTDAEAAAQASGDAVAVTSPPSQAAGDDHAGAAANSSTQPAKPGVEVAAVSPPRGDQEPGQDDQARASTDPAQAVSEEPAGAVGAGSEQEPHATSSAASPPDERVAALLAEAKAGIPPSFDIVRVEPDGRAVIAGRAAPGAEVELRSGTEVIDRVRASHRGDWVAIPGKPLSPGDQQLTLVAAQPGAAAIESDQMVVIAVPRPAAATAPVASAEMSQPMAVVLPRDGSGTGRILQAPGRLSAEGTLALMAVSYDDQGQMHLAGEAPPGVPVRVYVDNEPMGLVVGDANGAWSSGLAQVLKPGTYTLRLDQLDKNGQTVARIETPITRVSEPPIEGRLQVDYVVVQPGNSLWRIARRLSGRGMNYVYIYDSNQAQIRDPDLIYPGQVFQIPTEFDAAG